MITKVKFVLSMLLMAAMPSARVMADGIAINAADSPDETFHNYQLSQDYGQDGKLTEEEAVCKAMNFFSRSVAVGTGMKKAPRKSPSLIVACIRDEFYIFNDEANGGYVIVSCDERMPDVLGYSYDGHYSEDNVPDNLRSLLDMYARQVAYLHSHPEAKVMKADATQREPIAPMIDCAWSQGQPFNNMCPTISGEKAPTGCVATAMAQLMYYWKWPKQTSQPIPEYTTSTKHITIDEIPVTAIDWDNILPDYSNGDYTQQQADAVATLMKLCGAAVKMDYQSNESYASIFGPELCGYFDYNDQFESLDRYALNVSSEEWNQMMYDELAAGRPIMYDGFSMATYSGHQFLIDGYDRDGYFHVNLGWGAGANGYFLLSNIRDYNDGQSCIIGIRPANPEEAKAYAVLNNGTLTFYYDSNKNNHQGTLFIPIKGDSWNGIGPWRGDKKNIQKAIFDPSFAEARLSGLELLFCGCENLKTIEGIEYLNTSNSNSMYEMFCLCSSLKEIDLSHFDTKNVTNMVNMFNSCSSLKSLDLSSFNMQNVTSVNGMFADCTSLEHLNLSHFNTENVEDMGSLFTGCPFQSLDLSEMNTDKVTKMNGMFASCSSLKTLNLDNFKTEQVTTMECMFENCSSLTELDLSSFHTENVNNMYQMFSNCESLVTIYASEDWNTREINGFQMFYYCLKLEGGKGTRYTNYYETSDKFAHIDGGPDNPGYFTFKSGGENRIDMMENGTGQRNDAVVYNISGQRLSKPQRGVNIIDGKKVVVK